MRPEFSMGALELDRVNIIKFNKLLYNEMKSTILNIINMLRNETMPI